MQSRVVRTGSTVEISQIEVSARVIGIAGYSPLVGVPSLSNPTACQENVAAVQMRPCALRVRLDSSIVTGHRLDETPLLLQCVALIDEGDSGFSRQDWKAAIELRGREIPSGPGRIIHCNRSPDPPTPSRSG